MSRALAALIGVAGCLVAVAYAAGDSTHHDRRPTVRSRPPRPRIVKHPAKPSLSAIVAFTYTTRLAGAGFQCRLDGDAWRRCGTRVVYRGLGPGPHSFAVRVEAPSGATSRPARFAWVRAQPKSFAIEPKGSFGELFPGAPPVVLPLRLSNPNSAPILVTALRVAVSADPAGCESATNLALIPSNASVVRPLRIPARASVEVPTTTITAPALALRDLPVNQDACRNASFPLAFSGEAHG